MSTVTESYTTESDIDMISISLTHRCNLKCKMCWQRKLESQGYQIKSCLDYDDALIILDKIEKLSPAHVYLWGGEPLLHPRIGEIISQVKNKKFLCHLITNGVLLKAKADQILAARLDRLSISLDGVGSIHDSVRGAQGIYEKILDGLNYLLEKRKVRPIISINTVITESNYLSLYDTVKTFNKFSINGLQIQFPVFFNNETGNNTASYIRNNLNLSTKSWQGFVGSYSKINIKKLSEIIDQIRRDFPKVGFYPPGETAETWFEQKATYRPYCRLPWKRVNIEPNGDMVICTDYSDMVVGNLLIDSFEKIWNNRIYQRFRSKLVKNEYMPICKHCTYSHLKWK